MSNDKMGFPETLDTGAEKTVENQDKAIPEEVFSSLPDEVKNHIAALSNQKKHFREKFEKEKTERLTLEDKVKGVITPKEEVKPEIKSESPDEWKQKWELSMARKDLDLKYMEEVSRLAKAYNVPMVQVLDLPIFKAWQTVKAEQVASQNITPTPGSDSPGVDKFHNFEKIQAEDIKSMDSETFLKYEAYLRKKNQK